jgi:hypothetical protein
MSNETVETIYRTYMKTTGGSPEASATLALAEVMLGLHEALDAITVQDVPTEAKPVNVRVLVNGEEMAHHVMEAPQVTPEATGRALMGHAARHGPKTPMAKICSCEVCRG